MNFQQQLQRGLLAEHHIARWLQTQRGYHILPIYNKQDDNRKGPRFYTASGEQLIAPDILAMRGSTLVWVEAKSKTTFTWHRVSQQWQTGIDYYNYTHYCKVADTVPHAMYVFFLHTETYEPVACSGAPTTSPTGLYVQSFDVLRSCVHHIYPQSGRNRMVYWSIESLKKVAQLSEVV